MICGSLRILQWPLHNSEPTPRMNIAPYNTSCTRPFPRGGAGMRGALARRGLWSPFLLALPEINVEL